MKASVEIRGIDNEVQYFITDSSKEVINELLHNDLYNNCLKVGYEFELNNKKLRVKQVAAHEFIPEEINGMEVLLTAYVEEII